LAAKVCAALIATGASRAAVALFEMSSVSRKASRKKPATIATGPKGWEIASIVSAMRSAPPVRKAFMS